MRNYISGPDIANTVRMAHSLRRIAFLLVEGESDLYALQTFVLDNSCEILVCHSKQNVLDAVSELDRTGEPGFLAIADADFDHIEGRHSPSSNCILTEFHDLEVVLLYSPALDRVLRERASWTKLGAFQEKVGETIREVLFARAEPLGRLRLANEREGLSLRFDGLNLSKYVDHRSLNVQVDKVITAIVQRSSARHTVDQIRSVLDMQSREVHDLRLLCRGHDVVVLLGIALRKAIGTTLAQDATPEVLERELRLAFDRECFVKTRIYAALRAWEYHNPKWPVVTPASHRG